MSSLSSLRLRPNHMARDCAAIDSELFVRAHGSVAYGRDPYSGDWTDTAQLNYWRLCGKARRALKDTERA